MIQGRGWFPASFIFSNFVKESLDLREKIESTYQIMKTTQPIRFNPTETSNFSHKFPFVVQGLDTKWRDSKYGGNTIKEAMEAAKNVNCMTETTVLRIVRNKS